MMESSHVKFSVSHLTAQAVVHAVIERARALGVPQSVAVLDARGLVLALCRMAGAPLVSIETARSKALTALFGSSAPADAEALPPGVSRLPRFSSVGGGLPIVSGDRSIGAIGVSGGTAEQDLECAHAGLAAVHGASAPKGHDGEVAGRRSGGADRR
ncbi:GlcG/HbpS family heme-binding protein [Nannocystis punicea]|uniref:Heme-binding protein n=1 Tax=Nannocystis punicea TaxID=2995304 RepID=A0ABY7H8L5_9BACT|nr:heme-binding protein [Nannocystis poenicansa]WAS95609.1 heme-binding protein [Nannocystis poenicansa]